MRTVLELAGVRHVSAKVISRSKNPLNNARATTLALSKLKPARKRAVKKEEEKKEVVTNVAKKEVGVKPKGE
jgi:ribosomal protein S5